MTALPEEISIMKKLAKNDSSPFNRLPDDTTLDIFNKIIDLKTLFLCKLVCKSFNRIVHKLDTISFKAPSDWNTCGKILLKKLLAFTASEPRHIEYAPSDNGVSSFLSAIQSLTKFTRLKNLRIELPPVSSLEEGIYKGCLFKWKANISINGVDSFVFLSPNYIYDNTKTLLHRDIYDVAENGDAFTNLGFNKYKIADKCLMSDVMVRYRMLLCFTIDFPLLEKVFITDSCKRGRMSLSGAKLAEVRNGLNSGSQTFQQRPPSRREDPFGYACWCNSLLELPVSRSVMHDVSLYIGNRDGLDSPVIDSFDRFFNIDDEDDFEDEEDDVYAEAVTQMLLQ